MALQVTQSFDNAGEPKSSSAQNVFGGAIRDAIVQLNAMILGLNNRTFDNPAFARNANFDVANANAVTYSTNGLLRTLSATTNFDTGTTATITANLWGVALLTHNGTTATVTWAASPGPMRYQTEAAAIAAIGSQINNATFGPASGFSSLGYITVQAGASLWTAGTDALAGGTGGTPAATTNYYNDPTLNGTFGGWQVGVMVSGGGQVITT